MTEAIMTKLEDGVRHIQLNRPEKKNALTSNMYTAMAEALNESNDKQEIKVNLLYGTQYGTQGCFTAGNDIHDFLTITQTGKSAESALLFLKSLATLKAPLILAIDGPAIGIGTTMIFHADLVYATEQAIFQTPFLDLGLLPEAASSYLMPEAIGHHRAFELLCLGETYSAQKAIGAGFVNQLFPAETLIEEATAIAVRLAQKPAKALRTAKSLMRSAHKDLIQNTMERENELFKTQLNSAEAKNAFLAFLNK